MSHDPDIVINNGWISWMDTGGSRVAVQISHVQAMRVSAEGELVLATVDTGYRIPCEEPASLLLDLTFEPQNVRR